MITLVGALRDATRRLQGRSETPRLDAEVLLAEALGQPRGYLYAWPERGLTTVENTRFMALLERRRQGEPIAYILGRREFWSLELKVTPATLIPRPETELLVEQALARLPLDRPLRAADLGTGGGAVALAIARERPKVNLVATDNSAAALVVAADNARRLGVGNVEFRLGDWCDALRDEWFALIVSNPPYVAAGDPCLTQGDARFEPRAALVAGPDGLDALRRISAQAGACLEPGGWLLLEHGAGQSAAVAALLQAAGWTEREIYRDAAGLERVSGGRRPLSRYALSRRPAGLEACC